MCNVNPNENDIFVVINVVKPLTNFSYDKMTEYQMKLLKNLKIKVQFNYITKYEELSSYFISL